MNNKNGNIITYLLFLLLAVQIVGTVKAQEQIYLFPDKSYAVSGDTIWFTVFIYSENQNDMSQVVHVQLDNAEKNHIMKVSVLCHGAFGEGFIPIPDSLSTGLYILNSFSLVQKNSEATIVNEKFINVYNRFDNGINEINEPAETTLKEYSQGNEIKIQTNKEIYAKGEQVLVSYDIPEENLDEYQKIIITAGISDPVSEHYLFSNSFVKTLRNSDLQFSLIEKNGILISGKVTDRNAGTPISNAIVLLSIPDSIPFFDYCVSDEKGMFYFYLRNAVGTADLILQAVTKYNQDFKIDLIENFLDVQNTKFAENIFSPFEENFAENIVKASYYEKLFKGYDISNDESFVKPMQFNYTFYGEPTKTFDPNLFIDLPNFQEISREILRGVQYRERKDGITIRLLDDVGETIFNKEPLKLLDGIPVFNNEVFKPMTTADILKVDVVLNERFYGDLSFQGVLSVYTKNRSLDWVDKDSKIGHFKYACLQPPQQFEFRNVFVPNTNIPDLNKVLYRSSVNDFKVNNKLDFFTSDIKGDIELRLILIDKNNQIKYCHKLIKVE